MSRDCGLVLRFSSLLFTFERQEGRPEGSDLRQGFLPLKIVQPLRLKARSSFLYPSAMCLLDVWTRINELSLLLEVMHFDSRKNNMSALNNEHLVKIWNPGIVKARTRNCKLQLMRFVFSHEKPNAIKRSVSVLSRQITWNAKTTTLVKTSWNTWENQARRRTLLNELMFYSLSKRELISGSLRYFL